MSRFEFYSVGRVVFGAGQFAKVGELAAPLGKSVFVVYNGARPGGGGVIDRLQNHLTDAGVSATFVRQQGEPLVADVDGAVEHARAAGCDVVIGLGGGSAIDVAKAVAGLLGNGGSALDYMEVVGKGRKITRPAAPWVAIPTTAGTGAEGTRNAVIGFPEKHFKASIRSELLLPRIALIDPELGIGVPRDVTARSGMDALTQLIESYTSTGSQPITDALALKGIDLTRKSLERAFRDGTDLAARTDMALAAFLSGVTLTNAGLGAVHGFAAPLGASFPVPHGTACAALLPHVIAANVAGARSMSLEHPALARYAEVGRALAGDRDLGDADAIEACQRNARDLARRLDIPRLRAFGLKEQDVVELVRLAKNSSSMRYNPIPLSDEALAGVLRDAL